MTPPDASTPIGHYPWILIRLRCHVCARQADVRLTACVARYGFAVPVRFVLRRFMSVCPYDPHGDLRKPQKYGHRCGAYLPDLASPRPPDLPPAMAGLSVINGGKAQLEPSGPLPLQRRVGESEA